MSSVGASPPGQSTVDQLLAQEQAAIAKEQAAELELQAIRERIKEAQADLANQAAQLNGGAVNEPLLPLGLDDDLKEAFNKTTHSAHQLLIVFAQIIRVLRSIDEKTIKPVPPAG